VYDDVSNTPVGRRLVVPTFFLPLIAVVLSTSSGLLSVVAAEDSVPDPRKALRGITADFVKNSAAQGYSTRLLISGGMANNSDHEIVDQAVSEDYFGLVRGPLMHMPEAQIFRTVDKGAQFDGDIWRVLQSTADGKKLDRLFSFPELLLLDASKKSKSVEWLESTAKPRKVKRTEPRGRTAVGGSSETEERVYHRLRATLPEKLALEYFIDVQNSGCLSGG